MITENEVREIVNRLSLKDLTISYEELIKDLFRITYYSDMFECGDTIINNRHIDIEFSNGEYYELHETTSLFQFICSLCNIPLLGEEQELIIYEK